MLHREIQELVGPLSHAYPGVLDFLSDIRAKENLFYQRNRILPVCAKYISHDHKQHYHKLPVHLSIGVKDVLIPQDVPEGLVGELKILKQSRIVVMAHGIPHQPVVVEVGVLHDDQPLAVAENRQHYVHVLTHYDGRIAVFDVVQKKLSRYELHAP